MRTIYPVTISSMDALLVVSTVSGTILQLTAWDQLWGLLLAGVSATPQSSPEHGGDDVQGGYP
jgi:hypothetical protein